MRISIDYQPAAFRELLESCRALLNAPHQEHFAVRLNDEEMAGLNRIKQAVANADCAAANVTARGAV